MKKNEMSLKNTVENMLSDDYRKRFVAEYWQLKIRYDKLRDFCNRIEAAEIDGTEPPAHDCPLKLLRKQQRFMGNYLHILEVRAEIEAVNLFEE